MFITYNKTTGIKQVTSPDYNYRFNSNTGEFVRWGKTWEDDPKVGPIEILDLEISEVCDGIPDTGETVAKPCSFCYKSNTKKGRNMSFDTFKNIFDKICGGIHTVHIELANGTILKLNPTDNVLLCDGSYKRADQITDLDDIAI